MSKNGCWCHHSDPCGLCCVVFTYMLLCFADYVVDHALLYPWLGDTASYQLLKLSFFAISVLAMVSHCRTMLTDPGAVPLEYQPNTLLANEAANKMAMCSRCNGFKPPRAHHCSQCDRCIVKMDHHCPWVNNCVGINNQKHFVLFTFYTATLSLYAIILLIARAVYTAADGHPARAHGSRFTQRARGDAAIEGGGRFVLMAFLFFEALLFGLFTLAMLTEQLSSIITDQTGIERLKHDYVAPSRSWLHNLSETFGRPFSLLWLLPTAVKYNGLTWYDLLPQECEV